jgi:hypothetical protein
MRRRFWVLVRDGRIWRGGCRGERGWLGGRRRGGRRRRLFEGGGGNGDEVRGRQGERDIMEDILHWEVYQDGALSPIPGPGIFHITRGWNWNWIGLQSA